MKYAVIVVALFACGKKSEDTAAKKTSESSPSASPSPAPAATGSTKWMAIDPFGIEVEVPTCTQVATADNNSVNIVAAGGDGCTGMVLTFNNMGDKPNTFDDTLKSLTNDLSPEFARKDKTADGWIFEYKQKESGDTLPHLHVYAQFKAIQCVADTMKPEESAAQRHACETMRAKR